MVRGSAARAKPVPFGSSSESGTISVTSAPAAAACKEAMRWSAGTSAGICAACAATIPSAVEESIVATWGLAAFAVSTSIVAPGAEGRTKAP